MSANTGDRRKQTCRSETDVSAMAPIDSIAPATAPIAGATITNKADVIDK